MKVKTDEELLTLLKANSIGRNNQLSILMKFLNSFDKNTTLSIDGRWGSGKTVFVRQLKILNETNVFEPHFFDQSIDQVALQDFQDNYSVYYFNAWEHDYISDPLQALLYKLIDDFPENEGVAIARKAISKIDLTGLVKNLSKDAIDLKAVTNDEELLKEVKAVIDRKDSVTKILDKYLATSKKRMLFIVDELDRCKPSFAVALLEVIKHYFTEDQLVFLIATNTHELSHTIQKYYGPNFDGARYLNKFYDYNLGLKDINTEKYIESQLGHKKDGYFKNSIPQEISQHLNLSMREIDSYYTSLELLDKYMDRNNHWQPGAKAWLNQVVFVPFALALKTTQDDRYSGFVSGGGEASLRELCTSSKSIFHLAEKLIDDKTDMSDVALTRFILNTYSELFTKRDDDYDRNELLEEFREVISLISSYSTIKSSGDETDEVN